MLESQTVQPVINKRYQAIPALLLFIASVFITFILIGMVREMPQTIFDQNGGNVELTHFDFSSIARITGNWEHFPNELFNPDNLAGRTGIATSGGSAYGTYRMKIALPDDGKYTLAFSSVDYSTQVFINGELMQDVGRPGRTKEQTIPGTAYLTFAVEPEHGIVEIVVCYANFQHVSGGESFNVIIGTPQLMNQRTVRHAVGNAVIMGSLITAFLLLLGLFFFHPAIKANLYFAIAALLLAAREGMVGEQIFSTIFPNVPWRIMFSLQYLDLCLLTVILLLFVSDFFPDLIHKAVRWPAYGASLSYAALILLVDSQIYTAFLLPYQSVQALVIFYIAVRLVMKRKTLTFDQRISVIGMWVFFSGTLYDIAYFNKIFRLPIQQGLSQTAMVFFVFAQMAALFGKMERELSMAQKKEREIGEVNKMLERLNNAKTDFLENISHEMKTPLTVISNCAGVTLKQLNRNIFTDETKKNLNNIQQEAVRLGKLVEQLLNISMEKEHQVTFTKTDTSTLLRRTADFCAPICRGRDNQIILASESQNIPLWVNVDAIFQVLVNLVINADRQMKDGSITLLAQHDKKENSVVFQVADKGRGIAPDLLERVFERGVSGDGSNGLGLTICKEIVWEHGGEIKIKSSSNGTTVRFTLPCKRGGERK